MDFFGCVKVFWLDEEVREVDGERVGGCFSNIGMK